MKKEEYKINELPTEIYFSFKSKVSGNEFFIMIRGKKFLSSYLMEELENVLNKFEAEDDGQGRKRLSETC